MFVMEMHPRFYIPFDFIKSLSPPAIANTFPTDKHGVFVSRINARKWVELGCKFKFIPPAWLRM